MQQLRAESHSLITQRQSQIAQLVEQMNSLKVGREAADSASVAPSDSVAPQSGAPSEWASPTVSTTVPLPPGLRAAGWVPPPGSRDTVPLSGPLAHLAPEGDSAYELLVGGGLYLPDDGPPLFLGS